MEILVTNVNQALHEALHYLMVSGQIEDSRNGPVLVSPDPVMTTYVRPLERVLFSPIRDANPFFHLMEALWMLGGRNDVEWPTFFNSKFKGYSDDGKTFHGAYGYRWRKAFHAPMRTPGNFNGEVEQVDQLRVIAQELRRRPESRRCVLQMWSAGSDLPYAVGDKMGKDVPCNTHVYFDVRNGRLNMTVCNRSNDALWGAYGANAVHFSVLLEFMAAWVGVPVGVYRQFSNNLHAYTATLPADNMLALAEDARRHDYYSQEDATCFPLVTCPVAQWLVDLERFLQQPTWIVTRYADPFFNHVAVPMYMAWWERKNKVSDGKAWVAKIVAKDWSAACSEWITRREAKAGATP